MSRIRMTTLAFLLLALSPFVMSDSDYPLIPCPLYKSKSLWNIFMILGGNVEQDQTTCRVQEKTTLPFLLFVLSPFVMPYSDYSLISCLLC